MTSNSGKPAAGIPEPLDVTGDMTGDVSAVLDLTRGHRAVVDADVGMHVNDAFVEAELRRVMGIVDEGSGDPPHIRGATIRSR